MNYIAASRIGYLNHKLSLVFFMPQNCLKCITTERMRVKNLSNTQGIYPSLINLLRYTLKQDAVKLHLPIDRKSMASLLKDKAN